MRQLQLGRLNALLYTPSPLFSVAARSSSLAWVTERDFFKRPRLSWLLQQVMDLGSNWLKLFFYHCTPLAMRSCSRIYANRLRNSDKNDARQRFEWNLIAPLAFTCEPRWPRTFWRAYETSTWSSSNGNGKGFIIALRPVCPTSNGLIKKNRQS